MRDVELADLNFREIIDYGGQPPVRNRYAEALQCAGYCVSCEDATLLATVGGHLEIMSHGCDSSDFEQVLGPMPQEGRIVEQPVMFLLENPGGDKDNGEVVPFRTFVKKPPVFHYYWTPNVDRWPTSLVEFNGNFYGPYFAYLMRRHQLRNVYITNLVKCKWVDAPGAGTHDPSPIVRHCVARHLAREIQFFGPRAIVCFGGKAAVGFRRLLPQLAAECHVAELYHPSYIRDRYQTARPRRSREDLIRENDACVRRVVAQIV